jgi:hypothetical protein
MGESAEDVDPAADMAILGSLSAVHAKIRALATQRSTPQSASSELESVVRAAAADVASADVEMVGARVKGEARGHLQREGGVASSAVEIDGGAGSPASAGTSLEERARHLASGLSGTAARIYRALVANGRWPFATVLRGDWCGACNMRLPSSLVGAIRRRTDLHRCPFCKRVVAAADTTASA